MTVRKVLQYGDKCLREPCKEVHKVSKKIVDLAHDLLETMYSKNGVGLAAPQIGVNYRVFVLDVSKNDEPLRPLVFINPKIIKKSGSMICNEGCISFPEAYTEVKRYSYVMIKALDINGRPFTIEAKEGLLVNAMQHEYDHLDGILYIDRCINRFETDNVLQKFNLPPVEADKLISDSVEENK